MHEEAALSFVQMFGMQPALVVAAVREPVDAASHTALPEWKIVFSV